MKNFLVEAYHRLINSLDVETYRYLYADFNINNRLTGIVGARGVGKTTLMLQYIKENLYKTNNAFYFSADNIYFNKITILEFIEDFHKNEDVTIFFIDEVHKYKNWNQELKNIYDSFPNIKIIFSGSSSIDLIEGSYDLSRRAKIFNLAGLSLREYINFATNTSLQPISFSDLIANPKEYDKQFSQLPKIKKYFNEFMQQGYYPFVFEDPESCYEKITRVIEKTIYEDIANYYNLKTANLSHFKRILNFLASIPPGKINTHNLSCYLGIDNKTTNNYLKILQDTGLVRLIYPYEGGGPLLRKPEKVFLNNTTLLSALNSYLGQDVSKGTMRELFFVQSLTNAGIDVFYNKQGDFRTRDMIFEIGGKNKNGSQIKNTELPAMLVKDDVFVSSANTIPLFYFGFLY